MRRRTRRLIARSLSVALAVATVGTGTAHALTGTTQPQLTLNHLIRTSPFQGSSTAVRDNEGSAYVASDDVLWMASDNDDALFEVDRTTGALRRKVAQADFINAPRFGVGGSAGQARTEDLEALAYDANADVLYAFSGSTGATPTSFRLIRDGNHRFQVESWQPMPSEWTGAGWRQADGLTYVANGSTIRTYNFATNTLGPSFSISGLSKIFGVDFDDATGDLLAVNSSERLYRVSMTTRTLLPGWNGISLTGLGFLDTRAVEVIGEQLLVTDGADSSARPSSDPMSHAVFVLDVSGPGGPAPTASFTATPTTGTAPLAVNFTDTSSGSPASWAWTFGDGGTSTSPSPSHTYTATGTFTATLTATNSQGSTSASRTIIVNQPSAPTASFTASPTTGTAPLIVNFTDTSSGSPTSWAWTFGDGGTSNSPSPSHTYTATGTFTATLTATNGLGSTSASRTITVSTTAVITPSDDTQVNQAGTPVPGSAPSFSADGSPVSDGLLKFNVNVPGQITGAKLRLYCVDSSSVGGTFYAAADTSPPWSEGAVTWATAPVAGASYGSLGAVKAGTWYEVDLTPLVTANGTYSLRIKNTSGNGADYVTKEGAAGSAPQLVVTTA
jgi:PKD repeat protein